MARKSWGLRKIGIVGIPKQERDDGQQRQRPPIFRLTHRHFGPHSSPRSHSLITHQDLNRSWGRCSFTMRSFSLWLLPLLVWRRILHAWAALGCVSNFVLSSLHRFVTCPLPQEEIQRVKIFGWLYANNLYWIRQVRERGNMPNKCKRAESLPRCEKENFFFRFSAKITTQVLRQEESGSISPNDAAVELYEGEIYIHQHSHCQASNSREVLGSVVIRF